MTRPACQTRGTYLLQVRVVDRFSAGRAVGTGHKVVILWCMHRGGAVTVHLSPQAGSAWDDEAQVLTRLGEEVPLVQNSLVDEPTFEDALLDRAPHRAASRARGTPLLWAIRVKR